MTRAKLFILGRFAHDAQGVLAAIHRLALVAVELRLDVSLGTLFSFFGGGKLRVATLTDS